MKLLSISFFTSLAVPADARNSGHLANVAETHADSATATDADQKHRGLQSCWDGVSPANAWHPDYSSGWTKGHCRFKKDCNSPSYGTELACCKGAYAGQTSGHCLSQLPNPPTTSPTAAGGLSVYYPDYAAAGGWVGGHCTNLRPLPSGRPTYATMLACCKGAYAGQLSGTCLSKLPSPPTTAPTAAGGLGALWYPEYEKSWTEAGCSNKLPLPFGPGGRPTFDTQLTCCKGAYAGQMSGKCLSQLPSPPTTSPTKAGGLGALWYPDYETPWGEAGCSNKLPLPFGPGGRPTYDTQLVCCKGAYAGQTSGKCLSQLPSPPTTSPTAAGGADFWYPDYETPWADAGCSNKLPLPFGPGGRPTYDSPLVCCQKAYGGQMSGKCLGQLTSPPTTSPIKTGGLGALWYPFTDGCTNQLPLPVAPDTRPTFNTLLACCKGIAGSEFAMCLSDSKMPWTNPSKLGSYNVGFGQFLMGAKGRLGNFPDGVIQTNYKTRVKTATRIVPVDIWFPVDPQSTPGSPAKYQIDASMLPLMYNSSMPSLLDLQKKDCSTDILIPLDGVQQSHSFNNPPGSFIPAVPAAGSHPLVIFSHGLGGLPYGYFDILKKLASHGFAVVVLTHLGTTGGEVYSRQNFDGKFDTDTAVPNQDALCNRAKDIRDAITQMINLETNITKYPTPTDLYAFNPNLYAFPIDIDSSKIATMGHALGGFSALTSVLGFGDVGGCTFTDTPRTDVSKPDGRVAVAITLAQASSLPQENAFSPQEIKAVNADVLVLSSGRDLTTPPSQHFDNIFPQIKCIKGDSMRIELKNGGHNSYADVCTTSDLSKGLSSQVGESSPVAECKVLIPTLALAFSDIVQNMFALEGGCPQYPGSDFVRPYVVQYLTSHYVVSYLKSQLLGVTRYKTDLEEARVAQMVDGDAREIDLTASVFIDGNCTQA